jgi:hypothetical protein
MPDITADGKTRVYWVTTIANIAAPTVAELNAGISLQATLTADGLMGLQPETADVDTSSLASTFNTTSTAGSVLRHDAAAEEAVRHGHDLHDAGP